MYLWYLAAVEDIVYNSIRRACVKNIVNEEYKISFSFSKKYENNLTLIYLHLQSNVISLLLCETSGANIKNL